MTRDKPSYKVCDCICNRAAFFVLYERSLQKNNTAIGDEDGPSPTTTTPSTSAINLPRTFRGTTRSMGKLVCSVGQFFYINQVDASTSNQLNDRAKNAYLTTLLGSEGMRILMAHPVAVTAATADHKKFRRKSASSSNVQSTQCVLTSNSGRAGKVPASQSMSFLLHCACYTQTVHPPQ